MKTILDIINLTAEYFDKAGIARPRREAEEVVAEALKLKRIELYLQFERPLIEKELEACRCFLKRRAAREPWQYIRGEVDFYYTKLKVTRDVLIPRQETEVLVDYILKVLQQDKNLSEKTLWDICSGSGCIAISIKKALPALNVEMGDVSSEALLVALENCRLNGVDIKGVESDLMSAFCNRQADYIVVNPPYISEADYQNLEPEVKDYEPKLALVGGMTGLELYERLSKELKINLKKGGKAFFEIGANQGQEIKKIFENEGWVNGHIEKDWAGLDRFFFIDKD